MRATSVRWSQFSGRVEGDVVATGDTHSILVISEKARVIGKVMAAHVIINGEVDMVYANPFDASLLVRESGFVPLARPAGIHRSTQPLFVPASLAPGVLELRVTVKAGGPESSGQTLFEVTAR